MGFPNIKYCIGIAAGKGGVGKSTLSVLLSLALRENGFSAGILDADICGPSIPYMLGVETAPREENGFVIPATGQGVPFFSFAFLNEAGAAIRAPIANRVIEQCAHEIAWGELDFLLVDFPPGIGDIQLTALQTLGISGMLYVSTSQEVALLEVDKAHRMGQMMNLHTVGFIENMSHFVGTDIAPFGKGNVEKYAVKKSAPFIGRLPLDPAVNKALDAQKNPLLACAAETKEAVFAMVDTIVAKTEEVEQPFVCAMKWEASYATGEG